MARLSAVGEDIMFTLVPNVNHLAYIRSRLENCPYSSLAGYLIVIQQLLITRQVFYTLMFAMFSVTTNRTRARSVEIWKFQFYRMVTDFEQRAILPVPLTPITYPFRVGYYLGRYLFNCCLKYGQCENLRKRFQSVKGEQYDIPHHQWKFYMAAMTKKEEDKKTHIQEILAELEENSAANTVMAMRLKERLGNIENNQILTGFVLESLINSMADLDQDDKGSAPKRGQGRPVHTATRSSPYPGTTIARFPVLEKDVSWDVKFESYDPDTYTKPIEEFPADVQIWIDRDILKLAVQLEEAVVDEQSTPIPAVTLPDPEFNVVQTVNLPSGIEVDIDRTSYIRVGDNPIVYEVDSTGVPRNPMGRTGLRGRGSQWRWGPNHVIQAVISRIKHESIVAPSPGSAAKHNIEIIVTRENVDSTWVSLPWVRVQSGTKPYTAFCNYINRKILQEPEEETPPEFDQDEMIELLSRFASNDLRKKKKAMYTTLGFSAFLVYIGYCDDAANTDNAWKETEIWSFHYKYKDVFDDFIKDSDTFMWIPVSKRMHIPLSESVAVMEAVKIHNVQY